MSVSTNRIPVLAPQWQSSLSVAKGRGNYVLIGALVGVANIAVNMTMITPRFIDMTFMILSMIIVMVIPARPAWGIFAYLCCWLAMLTFPNVYATDMIFTQLAFFFFLGRFLVPWQAAAIFVATVSVDMFALRLTQAWLGNYTELSGPVFHLFMGLLLVPAGVFVRVSEQSRLAEARRAEERLEELRLEISREMHDLIAYSMSQTALRAQRAAADTDYPATARNEFAALEMTASDALHELRLLLRTLRRAAPELGPDIGEATGLGYVVTDLGAAVRAVVDDIAAADFDITYRCQGGAVPTRSQASVLSRVAREMAANVVRHADPSAPVTMTLLLGPDVIRLVSTNRIRSVAERLPRSGTGVLGMHERLTAIGGTLTTLADNGSWIVTATVPVERGRTAPIRGVS